MSKTIEMNDYLESRKNMLISQIREKITILEERKGQVLALEIEIQQHKGAIVEVVRLMQSIKLSVPEIVTEENISDDDNTISE